MATLRRTVPLLRTALPPLLVPAPLGTCRAFSTTSTALKSNDDARPASSQLFPASKIASSISKLTSQGFDESTIWEQRVVWGDHDAFGHVNNVNYVRWLESSRMFFVEKVSEGFTRERKEDIIRGKGKSIILAKIDVKYIRPVTYPDVVLVGQAAELPLQKDRFNMRAVIYSVKQQAVVAVSNQDCVSYDYRSLKKCDIPADLRIALEKTGISASQLEQQQQQGGKK
ncbi:uncharacterized protein PFL1_03432 [Pseudozyma flocculosa PF-1]|uniref:Thioesterase domain-containing protein n=2 Tax=Pseudozyma flocculosa TaxID=84751 RepID=A0A5C3FDX2_9BASI|nr:uncharacterized protein PFL1_03432 [Pseudozyma flocculosa PF-1]EPQ29145.1 hypothetical protein PFL1_03432 [Pseudozyma flocculosa PF-1]SPO41559.1 uncharacterized protein PSFLO_07041 [Pseudozyma flocculosa]